VYWRAAQEFSISLPERRYERVAQLFASALERLGDNSIPAPLLDAARELGEQLGTAERKGGPAARLTAALKAGGYEPATDAVGAIRLRNCPFSALANEHRWLVCGTNLAIAEGMAHGLGATTVRPVLDFKPGFCCVVFVPDTKAREPVGQSE
jgi:predicted ArsR family transcriptional regulator